MANSLCLAMKIKAIRSKEVVLFLSDSLYIVTQNVSGGMCLVIVLLFSTLCPSNFAIILEANRELVALL